MNRRLFSKHLGIASVGAAMAASTGRAADVARNARSEKKEWAREHLKGLNGLVMPSFTPDFKALDEAGIRADIQHAIAQGFTSCTVSANGANAEQSRRMWQLLAEETAGKTGMGAIGGDAAFLQSLGCQFTMISYPRSAKAETEDDVYRRFREIIDATSMAVLLYGSPVDSLRRFHPSGIPLNVFDRLADHPNVVGMKLTHPMSPATAYEICERLSDRLVIGPCNFDHLPFLSRNFKNVQWSGLWITDALQSPAKPYGVEMMNQIIKGNLAEAMKVYWQMQPLIQGIYDLQAPLIAHEGHPWLHMKYLQWTTGGNGGLLPLKQSEYLPALDTAGRDLIRANFKRAGITPLDRPEEEFLVGRAAYAKGVRAAQLSSKPLYV
ncbi:MAG: dihydrodipicolinate synthase family protein [Acidobacteriota bacterium]